MELAPTVVELLKEPIGKQLGYLTFYNRNVKKFKEEVEKLVTFRDTSLEPRLAEALENGETINEAVQSWKKQVDDINKLAGTFERRCWKMSRYSLSRKAKKMTQDVVNKLQVTSEKITSGPISHYLSSGWPEPTTTGESSMGGESNEISFIVNDVLETFKDDKMYLIEIHGKDRVDMSRLMNTIFIKAKDEEFQFQYGARGAAIKYGARAAAIKQSKEDIQDDIAFGLGMTNFSRSNTAPVRHHRLSNRLKDKTKKLILLEDACEILDLEAIGIPFGEGEWNKTCKIIITSSEKSICEKILKTQKNYKLEIHKQMLLFGDPSTGILWDDGAHTTIRRIIVGYNRAGICSFQTEYDDNGDWSRSSNHELVRKSKHDKEEKIKLKHPDEFLVSVSGFYKSEGSHVVLHSLKFESNKQTFGPLGGPAETDLIFFTSSTEAGKIIGFYGRKNSDDSLGALGYYYEEPISIPADPEQPPISIPAGPEQPPISIPAGPEQPPISIPAGSEQPPISIPAGSSGKITMFRQVGGDGGSPWNDGPDHTTVRHIKLQVGHVNVLTGLSVEYDTNDGSLQRHAHGNESFYTDEFELDPGEFLISMSGTTRVLYDRWRVVSSLKFESNRRTFGPYGDESGDPFSTSPTHSGKIVGFHGKIGAHLDSIGAYFKTFSNS